MMNMLPQFVRATDTQKDENIFRQNFGTGGTFTVTLWEAIRLRKFMLYLLYKSVIRHKIRSLTSIPQNIPTSNHRRKVVYIRDHTQLPTIKYEFNKRNFIVRSLHNYLWLCNNIIGQCCHFVNSFVVHSS